MPRDGAFRGHAALHELAQQRARRRDADSVPIDVVARADGDHHLAREAGFDLWLPVAGQREPVMAHSRRDFARVENTREFFQPWLNTPGLGRGHGDAGPRPASQRFDMTERMPSNVLTTLDTCCALRPARRGGTPVDCFNPRARRGARAAVRAQVPGTTNEVVLVSRTYASMLCSGHAACAMAENSPCRIKCLLVCANPCRPSPSLQVGA